MVLLCIQKKRPSSLEPKIIQFIFILKARKYIYVKI